MSSFLVFSRINLEGEAMSEVNSEDRIPENEPVCLNCHDDGCDYCGDANDPIDDDGQPTEYEEWQDLYGGDDWDHGQYDDYGGW